MAMKINDDCIICGACKAECPCEAITEGDEKYIIEAAKCTECQEDGEPQCVDACPSEAIEKV